MINLDKLQKKSREVCLTQAEKKQLDSAVFSAVTEKESVFYGQSKYSRLFGVLSFISKPSVYISAAVALFLLVGSGVSYAAEQSLPGESLYAVKTGVNERVISFLTPSDESKVQYELYRTNKRLKEAQELAVAGKLTPDTEKIIETNLNSHVATIDTHIQKLKTDNSAKKAIELNSDLQSTLSSQERVLASLNQKEDGATTTTKTDSVISVVRENLVKTSQVGLNLEEAIADDKKTDNDYENAITKETEASSTLAQAQSLFVSKGALLRSKDKETLTGELVQAENLLQRADVMKQRMLYNEVYILSQKVEGLSNDVILFLKSEETLPREVIGSSSEKQEEKKVDIEKTTSSNSSDATNIATSTDAIDSTNVSTTTVSARGTSTSSTTAMILDVSNTNIL